MAKATTKKRAISLNTDDFVPGGGLPDDFDGEIVGAVFEPYNYQGSSKYQGPPLLAARLTIKPDDGDEFPAFYSVGKLNQFQPSNDGDEPVADMDGWSGTDEDIEEYQGQMLVPVSDKAALAQNSNFFHFLTALKEAGGPSMGDSLENLVGVRGHFNRVPQMERKGLSNSATGNDGQTRQREILVITAVEGKKSAAKGKPAAAAKGKNEEAPEVDEFDAVVEQAIVDILTESDGEMERKKVATALLKSDFIEKKDKTKAVKRLNDDEFLAALTSVAYDPAEGTLSIA